MTRQTGNGKVRLECAAAVHPAVGGTHYNMP